MIRTSLPDNFLVPATNSSIFALFALRRPGPLGQLPHHHRPDRHAEQRSRP
jgi:hypothetical protein